MIFTALAGGGFHFACLFVSCHLLLQVLASALAG